MKHHRSNSRRRWKGLVAAAGAVAAGVVLLGLSQWVKPASATTQPAQTQTAPAVPPVIPAPAGEIPLPNEPGSPNTPNPNAAALNMSGILLMFSMMAFIIAIIAVGWVIYDVRISRPAWKTQTRYPTRR